MNELDYKRKLNKNTLDCWLIMALILSVSYVLEIIKHERDIVYVSVFSALLFVPIIIATIVYIKDNTSNKIASMFSIGYMTFYTFSLLTAKGVVNFTYIFPLVSVLIVYCNRKLIVYTFAYVIMVNILAVLLEYKGALQLQYEQVQHWEIQILSLIFTLIFLYKSSHLLILKNDILTDVIDDIYEDGLTGLKNVRFIDEELRQKFDYKQSNSFCIAFIDIDDFKQFNTLYGHSVGDTVLKYIANIFLKHVAYIPHTYAIRNGGDEFIIVSQTMSSVDFISLLDKIRLEVYNLCPEFLSDEDHISISIGVASKVYDRKCKSFSELYDLADSRNYIAKSIGKNRLVSKS